MSLSGDQRVREMGALGFDEPWGCFLRSRFRGDDRAEGVQRGEAPVCLTTTENEAGDTTADKFNKAVLDFLSHIS